MLDESPRPLPMSQRLPARQTPLVVLAIAALAALLASCGGGDAHGPPCATASCVELELPPELGPRERSPARFDHAIHTQALSAQGCEPCHSSPKQGDFSLRGVSPWSASSRSGLIDEFHGLCVSCHEQRQAQGQKSGPELCGGCHRGSSSSPPTQKPAAMDLSLHQRHLAAFDGKCDKCHHVYDDVAQKLVYREGQESSCRDCHGDKDEGRKLSWRHAAHRACVGCHQTPPASGAKTGPSSCVVCHDPVVLGAVARLDPVPRLNRRQPTWIWLRASWATTATVIFSHEKHEATSAACSTCHHKTLRKCEECHTEEGNAEGGGVTLESAFHDPDSARSCVGCHERTAASDKNCAGCHGENVRPSGAARCAVCHAAGDHPRAGAAENPAYVQAQLGPLPGAPELPDKDLVITDLASKYQGAKMPHPSIIRRLDAAVRNSPLATRFHGQPTTLCSGCHHHEAQETKASRCTACHGTDDASRDHPSALHAYHRQCIDCHREMDIKAVGCTDCHAKAEANQ